MSAPRNAGIYTIEGNGRFAVPLTELSMFFLAGFIVVPVLAGLLMWAAIALFGMTAAYFIMAGVCFFGWPVYTYVRDLVRWRRS